MEDFYNMSISELNIIQNQNIQKGNSFIWKCSRGSMPNFSEAVIANGFCIKTMLFMNKYRNKKITLVFRDEELFSCVIDSYKKCEHVYKALLKKRFSKLEVKC